MILALILMALLCLWLGFRAFIHIEPPVPETLYYDPVDKHWFFSDHEGHLWSRRKFHEANALLGRYLVWRYGNGEHPGAFD